MLMETKQKHSLFSLDGSFYKTVCPFLWSLPIFTVMVEARIQVASASICTLRGYNECRASADPHWFCVKALRYKGYPPPHHRHPNVI